MKFLKMTTASLALGFCLFSAQGPARADDYTTAVFTKVAHAVVYPKMAKLRGEAGAVTCAVVVGADGALTGVTVEGSSGIPLLDDAAVQAVKAAAPFDAPPKGDTTIHGRVRFVLEVDAEQAE